MSDCIVITIQPASPVSVTIYASVNPVLPGSPVTFTAIAVNGGTHPSYQWKVNGSNAGTNLFYYTYVPVAGDKVTCIVTSDLPCTSNNPAASNVVTMQISGIYTTINVNGTVFNGVSICYNATPTMIVAGEGNTFTVQNGGSATMIASRNIRYLPGTTVAAGGYMHGYISTVLCHPPSIPSTVTGNEEPKAELQLANVVIYPNPTSGDFTVEYKGEATPGSIRVDIFGLQGERVLAGSISGEKKRVFSSAALPEGMYFVKVVADGTAYTFKLIKVN